LGSYFMFVNACRTQIAVPGITATALEIPVVNTEFFPVEIPPGKRLALTLHHEGVPGLQEIVYCTGISGNVLTVIRGREGTTPQAWIAGTVIGAYLTADILDTVANQDEMAAETLAQMLLWAEDAEDAELRAEQSAENAEIDAARASQAAGEAEASAAAAAAAEQTVSQIILDAEAAAQAVVDAQADAARADQAADEAEASAAQALQSAIDASGLGFQTASGTLLQGQDTVTLPWEYDLVRKNVAVYLGRTKEPQISLTFIDETHIQVGRVMPEDTPYEVLSLVMASASILDDFYNGAQAAAVAAELAEDGAQAAQSLAEDAQAAAEQAQAGAEAARDQAVSAAADRNIEAWNGAETYVATSLVIGSDGHKYICILGNTGVDPVGDNATYWVDLSVFGLQLGETEVTAYRGDRGKEAYDHSNEPHAPANAQKNSNITKGEIEAKLNGIIESHSHPGMIPAGTVFMYAGATVPTGYLRCTGAAVSRTTYAALFAAIGTMYGNGNGSTTFNLPEVRGEFPRFADDGRGVDPGRVLGSWQADMFKAHSHSLTGFGNHDDGGNHVTGGRDNWQTRQTAETGGSETRPRNVALLGIIKF